MKRRQWRGLILFVCLILSGGSLAGADEVKVTGLGLLRNMKMDRRLEFLQGEIGSHTRKLDSPMVEDGAFLLLQLLRRQGYPQPEVTAELHFDDGSKRRFSFPWPFTPRLPPDLEPERVVYECAPGKLEVYGEVRFSGLSHLDKATAQSFFKPQGGLFQGRRQRAFTEQNLKSRTRRLLATLEAEGYREARIEETRLEREEGTGVVHVHLFLEEGRRHYVGKVVRRVRAADGSFVREETQQIGEPVIFTGEWRQDAERQMLFEAYREGFPEAKVSSVDTVVKSTKARVLHRVEFLLHRGPRVRLAEIAFSGPGKMRESVLRRQLGFKADGSFNLLEVEEGRRRLLGLGIFRDVGLETEEIEAGRRVVYQLEPGRRESLSLRFGWGSYERGRAGIRWEKINPFGRAHRYRLEIKRSFKDFEIQGSASLPHFFDRGLHADVRARYSNREEISFERSLYDLRFQLSRRLRFFGADLTFGYLLEDVQSDRASAALFPALDEAVVSSLDFRFTLDRRDNTLHPTKGFDLQVFLKAASELLGGEADFLRWEASTSWHFALTPDFLFHLSGRYGLLQSGQPIRRNLPFSERFFPGGSNSVRGYQRGEAAPVLAGGDRIGAEVFALANLEFEVRVTKKISAVLFWDAVRMDRASQLVPRAEALESLGIGLRWQSIVGPIRLEYGHNLDPRKEDPSGTLHFAVGYPF